MESSHTVLSLVRQCELVGISRSSWYYAAKGESALYLELLRLIDEQYLHTPWYGSRQMARHLRRLGYAVGRKRVRRLMRVIGLRERGFCRQEIPFKCLTVFDNRLQKGTTTSTK